jgi:hypothetical protein
MAQADALHREGSLSDQERSPDQAANRVIPGLRQAGAGPGRRSR